MFGRSKTGLLSLGFSDCESLVFVRERRSRQCFLVVLLGFNWDLTDGFSLQAYETVNKI